MAGQAVSQSADVAADDDQIRDHNRKVYADRLAQLHDVPTVQKRLHLGRSKTFELIRTNKLRSVKVGRRRLVSEAALTEYIENLDAGGAA